VVALEEKKKILIQTMVMLPVTMVAITMVDMSTAITIITMKIIIKSLLPEIKYSSWISSLDQLLIRSEG